MALAAKCTLVKMLKVSGVHVKPRGCAAGLGGRRSLSRVAHGLTPCDCDLASHAAHDKQEDDLQLR